MKRLSRISPLLLLVVAGCFPTDDRPFAFRWGWDRGVAKPGKPGPINPEYDAQGNLIVPAEVSRTYRMPDISSGVSYDVKNDKWGPALTMEVFEVKLPKVGWFASGVYGLGLGLVASGVYDALKNILQKELNL
jgi:hypothetical protein